ncbi:MAG: prepilin-type N-terminal cleavage/methylation domain-containing protein [Candidatus Omnitrophota bacterium]
MTKRLFSGFTLVEVITVTIIIGVMVVFVIPNISASIERSRVAEGQHILLAIFGAQKRYALENNGSYANNLNLLDVTLTTPTYFGAPTILTGPTLAQMTRSGSYTLSINTSGIISCSGGAAGLCQKIGY